MPTEQEIIDWYNKIYSANGEKNLRPCEAYSIFLDYLTIEKGKKLLDVSCGTGYLLLLAANRGLDTYGIDISAEAVKIAEEMSPKSKITVGKGEDLKFDDKTFNYISCLGSLEHFLDIDKGLQEMKRVAKDNASLCIMLPNSNFLYWKISRETGSKQQDINETLMTNKEWQEIFYRNGLEVINVYQDKWFMNNIKFFESINPVKIIKNIILKVGWAFLPLNWTYQFIYILKKAD